MEALEQGTMGTKQHAFDWLPAEKVNALMSTGHIAVFSELVFSVKHTDLCIFG